MSHDFSPTFPALLRQERSLHEDGSDEAVALDRMLAESDEPMPTGWVLEHIGGQCRPGYSGPIYQPHWYEDGWLWPDNSPGFSDSKSRAKKVERADLKRLTPLRSVLGVPEIEVPA
ncbi:hypothetical protein ACI3EY_16835 [Ornithinimicrobium sp. LYQ92]|uniref:hypothetical protein n=1 Tax=Serinicoccus sp. LYQ92 TaxID=3378798 RepID=UPI003851C75A